MFSFLKKYFKKDDKTKLKVEESGKKEKFKLIDFPVLTPITKDNVECMMSYVFHKDIRVKNLDYEMEQNRLWLKNSVVSKLRDATSLILMTNYQTHINNLKGLGTPPPHAYPSWINKEIENYKKAKVIAPKVFPELYIKSLNFIFKKKGML